ncbi:recombination mediator RecR [Rothia sp. AR01]|uniref:Recombination protein RecR n=1 Tax=Rothia santali TaxID=2949643 RepID=A0A9X2HK45_9MICC|nr:recombination mediator RecR [Rothia santali]MCP3427201.1 recombination mediator RecR [Rothia santali]
MYQGAVQDLIDELGRLPGVGPKSAQRIAFYILNSPAEEMEKLAGAITMVKSKVSFCEICGNISEAPKCSICRDARRDSSIICVVEEPKDVSAIERTGSFSGRYHVLGGSIDPMQGIGPERLRVRELVTRLSDESVQEIILAMDPNLEGEATATYLSRMLTPIGVTVSRLASGLPVGGDLEYADEITLGRAMEGRRILTAGQRRAQPAQPAQRSMDEELAEDAAAADAASEPAQAPGASGSEELDGASASGSPDAGTAPGQDANPDSDADADDAPLTGSGPAAQDSGTDDAGAENPTQDPAPQAPPADPYRRYPTPRRGEKFANPWAD